MKTVTCELSSIVPSSNDYCKGLNPSSSHPCFFSSSSHLVANKFGYSAPEEPVSIAPQASSSLDLNPVFDLSKAKSSSKAAAPAKGIPCGGQSVSSSSSSLPYLAGIDTLHIPVWVNWGDSSFLDQLETARDDFRCSEKISPDAESVSYELVDGVSFNLYRIGTRKFGFRLVSADVTLLFSRHDPNGQFANCCIEIGSMSCWNPGWNHVARKMFSLIEQLGGRIVKHHIKRVDPTVDMLGLDFSKTELDNYKFWISRGREGGMRFNDCRPNYYHSGKSPMMMRVYDKTTELKKDIVKKEFFEDLWASHFGFFPDHVTRLEFEIGRRILRELNINTIDDLENKLNSLWLYAVGSEDHQGWCRFCEKPVSLMQRLAGNSNKVKASPVWKAFQNVVFNAHPKEKLERLVRPNRFNRERLRQVCVSTAITLAAGLGLPLFTQHLEYSEFYDKQFVVESINHHVTAAMNEIVASVNEYVQSNYEEYVRRYETKKNTYHSFIYDDFYKSSPPVPI